MLSSRPLHYFIVVELFLTDFCYTLFPRSHSNHAIFANLFKRFLTWLSRCALVMSKWSKNMAVHSLVKNISWKRKSQVSIKMVCVNAGLMYIFHSTVTYWYLSCETVNIVWFLNLHSMHYISIMCIYVILSAPC